MMGLNSRNAPALDLPARFMALSIAAFTVAVLSSPWTLPLLRGGFGAFSLLAFVHLLTLGYIGAMIIGASYQLVPVALQSPLGSVRLGRASFWFYAGGLGLFLAGLTRTWLPGLSIGGTLLGVAFALYFGVIAATWRRAPHRDVVAWHILLGLIGAGAGMSLGVLLAINKSTGMLGDRLLGLLGAHITVMLAGWVGLTLTGVAYRLIGMFTLSEKFFIAWLAWLELALVGGGTLLLALRFAVPLPAIAGQLGAVAVLAGFGCFAAQMARLYRRRMRRSFDIHIPFAMLAGALAVVAATLLTIGLLRHSLPTDPLWIAVGWLAILGVAGSAIQGFFYKIATFLVWLKQYAPVAGTRPVPKLEELYNRRLAMAGWALWTTAIVAGAVLILLDVAALRLVALPLIGGAGCFLVNVIAIARHWIAGRWPSTLHVIRESVATNAR
ncbi:MAG TPA: hypothetical protein VM450_12195 [Thermomicrobiales bacterium]|nr:hypothetical protein [Thermomicrobiales bacterium]